MKFKLSIEDAIKLVEFGISTVAMIREARAKRRLEVVNAAGEALTDAEFDEHLAQFDQAADTAGANAAARIEGRHDDDGA